MAPAEREREKGGGGRGRKGGGTYYVVGVGADESEILPMWMFAVFLDEQSRRLTAAASPTAPSSLMLNLIFFSKSARRPPAASDGAAQTPHTPSECASSVPPWVRAFNVQVSLECHKEPAPFPDEWAFLRPKASSRRPASYIEKQMKEEDILLTSPGRIYRHHDGVRHSGTLIVTSQSISLLMDRRKKAKGCEEEEEEEEEEEDEERTKRVLLFHLLFDVRCGAP